MKGVPHQNLSKEARLDLVLYLINAGRVGLLEEEKSLDLLLHQLRQFPNGKYDDVRIVTVSLKYPSDFWL